MRKFLLAAALAVIGLWGGAAHATCPTVNPNQFGPPFTDACPLPAAGLNILAQGLIPAASTTIYLQTGGTGTGYACLSLPTACGTLANAVAEGVSLVAAGQNVVIAAQDAGPFLGGNIVFGPTARGRFGTDGNFGLPYLQILGLVDSPVVIDQQLGGQNAALLVSNGSSLYLKNVTLETNVAGGFGVSVFGNSQLTADNVTVDSSAAGITGTAAFVAGWMSNMTFINTTVNGAWDYAIEGEDNGHLFLSNGTTFTCGGAYSYVDAHILLRGSTLVTNGATWSGCPTTGVALQAAGGSQWVRSPGTDDILAGNSYRINGADTVNIVQYVSTLGTCTNGALVSGSSNYGAEVDFTGSSTSCQILFGLPSSFASYYHTTPACTVSGTVPVTGVATTTSVTATGTFINGTRIYMTCVPRNFG